MLDQQEISRLLTQEEVRLRSLWKSDYQAALRGDRTALLDHAERVIKEEIEKLRAAIVSDLRKQLGEFRSQLEKQAKDAQAHRQKTLEEVLGLSENMEDRLRDHIPVYINEIVRQVLKEKDQK